MPMTTSTAPRAQPLDDGLLLLRAAEAREELHAGGKGAEAVAEGVEVLLGEDGGGHEDRDLAAVGHDLEGRTQRDFRLAVADVSRDEPVHGARALEVGLDVFDRARLVGRLLEAERGLEFALPGRVRGKRRPLRHGARRVEAEELLGHLPHRRAHRFLDPLPGAAAHPVEPRRPRWRAHVLRDEVESLDRQVEPPAFGVFEEEEVRLAAVDRHGLEPVVAADPVHLVDDEVIGIQVGEGRDGLAALEDGPAKPAAPLAEDVRLREEHETDLRKLEAGGAIARDDAQAFTAPERRARPGLEVVLGQDAPEADGLLLVVDDETHGETLRPPPAHRFRQLLEASLEAAHRARAHGHARRRPGPSLEQRQLEPLEPRESFRQRHGGRRVLRRRFEERGIVEDDQRVARHPGRQQDGRIGVRLERQHHELADRLDRALGGRIEEPQRFHLIAHELGAGRLASRGREDVDDAAAQAPLPDFHHGLHALVARGLEPAEERVALVRVSDRQGERARAKFTRREERSGERRGRRDHDHRTAAREVVAGERALRRVVAVPAPPRGGLGRRELQHARVVLGLEGSEEEARVLGQPVALHRARRKDERRPAGQDHEGRGHERSRGAPESVGLQARLSPGEGRRQLIQRGPPGQEGIGCGNRHESPWLASRKPLQPGRVKSGAASARPGPGRSSASRARWRDPRP